VGVDARHRISGVGSPFPRSCDDVGVDGPHVICEGPRYGEGPVWCPPGVGDAEGTLVCTSVSDGTLSRVWPSTGRRDVIADVGGSANGAALCADGGLLVTQNGGLDLSQFPIFRDPPPPRFTRSGLQRVAPDGALSYLTPDPLQMPNDLAVAPDGTVVFTDPHGWPLPDTQQSRVMALQRDGSLRVLAGGFWYANGVGVDVDGETLIVVENGHDGTDHGFVRVRTDGSREPFARGRIGDGFALDVDGRLYMAGGGHVVTVYEADGTLVEQLDCPGDYPVATNCCFGGDDLRTLFAVDAGAPGHVYCWTGMPTPGLPLHPWPGLA
jgi:gluconolactonase